MPQDPQPRRPPSGLFRDGTPPQKRRPRNDAPDTWLHVGNRAIAKRPYFESRVDQRAFLANLAVQVRAGRIEVHAYCLMTTHFHLLVRSPIGELSEAMRRGQSAYSQHFNRRQKRDGSLIRGRFFSKRIDTDRYWRSVVRYIDANPVRAHMVATAAEHGMRTVSHTTAVVDPKEVPEQTGTAVVVHPLRKESRNT